MVWHEIVNDIIDGESIVVTYCPLCETAMVIGVILNGQAKAYPIKAFSAYDQIEDKLAGEHITISYNANQHYPKITNQQGEAVPSVLVCMAGFLSKDSSMAA